VNVGGYCSRSACLHYKEIFMNLNENWMRSGLKPM
jgi:hypothetical protein